MFTQSVMFIFAATLALVTMSGRVTVGWIYLLAALTSATAAFDSPARQALVPNLVPNEHLTNALSLNYIMAEIASIVGPGLAGLTAWLIPQVRRYRDGGEA